MNAPPPTGFIAGPRTAHRPPVLADGWVTLRGWQPNDVPALHDAYRDVELRRRVPVTRPFKTADVSDFALRIAGEQWTAGRGAPFAVVDAFNGKLLASVVIRNWDRIPGTAEAGYWVAAHARRRGVAVTSMRLLCRWGFDELGLERIVFEVDLDNQASRAVAVRLGAEPMPPQDAQRWSPGGVGSQTVLLQLDRDDLTA